MALCFGTVLAQQNKVAQQTPKEPTAEELYEKAFDYKYGRNGVIMDSLKTADLFEQSAQMGFAKAQVERACIEKSDSVALKWLLKAAAQDCHYAMPPLFSIYYNGKNDVPKDINEAYKWLKKGAELGSPWCQWLWGYTYHFGDDGFPVNANQAIYWLEKVANQKQPEAANELAEIYAFGDIVEKNINKAIYWFQIASDLNDSSAQYNLALCYLHGNGVDVDEKKAFELTRKAASSGYPEAQNNLGIMFLDGVGCKKNIESARYWFGEVLENKRADEETKNMAKHNLRILDSE